MIVRIPVFCLGLSLLFLSVSSFGLERYGSTETTQFQDEYNASADSIDIVHSAIHLKVPDLVTKFIQGYAEVFLVARTEVSTSFSLDLKALTVDSVRWRGQALDFDHNGEELRLFLTEPLGTGDTATYRIYYHGVPVVDPSGWGGYYLNSGIAFNLGVGFGHFPHNYGRAWFPCLDNFTDRSLFDCYITVPTGKTAVCGGNLLASGPAPEPGYTLFHWKISQPIPSYLVSMAVGPFTEYQAEYSGSTTIPVRIYARSPYASNVAGSFATLQDAMEIYEARFGPYRWDRVGYVVVPFTGGAMEHAMNITYPEFAVDGTTERETLMAHELSHHWFGNLLTCHSDSDMWINEGWASYCENVFLEGLHGTSQAQSYQRSRHKANLQFLHHEEGGFLPVFGLPHDLTYSSHVYEKGADVVHALRGTLGDSLFFTSVRSLLDQMAFKDISTSQLMEKLSLISGFDLQDFFEGWVFQGGWPHFSIDSVQVQPMGGGFETRVFGRQRTYGTSNPLNSGVLPIRFYGADWQVADFRMPFSGTSPEAVFQLPFNPVAVLVDPSEQISDATVDKVVVQSQTGETLFSDMFFSLNCSNPGDSALIQVTHHWVAPDSCKTPHPEWTLSPNRYWSIHGILPQGFHATAKFSFSKKVSGDDAWLDNDLLTTGLNYDSLILLYRPGPQFDWERVPFTLSGFSYAGKLQADTLRLGEYCLAMSNRPQGLKKPAPGLKGLRVYPNPSGGKVEIRVSGGGLRDLEVQDYLGKRSPLAWVSHSDDAAMLDTTPLAPGVYVIRARLANGQSLSERLIVGY